MAASQGRATVAAQQLDAAARACEAAAHYLSMAPPKARAWAERLIGDGRTHRPPLERLRRPQQGHRRHRRPGRTRLKGPHQTPHRHLRRPRNSPKTTNRRSSPSPAKPSKNSARPRKRTKKTGPPRGPARGRDHCHRNRRDRHSRKKTRKTARNANNARTEPPRPRHRGRPHRGRQRHSSPPWPSPPTKHGTTPPHHHPRPPSKPPSTTPKDRPQPIVVDIDLPDLPQADRSTSTQPSTSAPSAPTSPQASTIRVETSSRRNARSPTASSVEGWRIDARPEDHTVQNVKYPDATVRKSGSDAGVIIEFKTPQGSARSNGQTEYPDGERSSLSARRGRHRRPQLGLTDDVADRAFRMACGQPGSTVADAVHVILGDGRLVSYFKEK